MKTPQARIHVHGFLVAALIVSALGCDEKHPEIVATPPAVVDAAVPIEREVTDYQVFTARTQAVESVDIKARVTGYLTGIHFNDGDIVQKDQVLFQIDNRPYKASLDLAKANLELAKAALIKDQADYDIALSVQKRDKSAISQQEVVKRLGTRDEAQASVDKAKADLEKAQLYYDWCKVASPLTGRANRHFLDIGNLVTQDSTTLTNIVSLKPVWAYIDVDQNTVLTVQQLVAEGKIKKVRKSKVPADMGLANSSGFPFQGYIDFISNQVDPNTGTLRVRAVYPNDDLALGAGFFARVRLPVGSSHKALLVTDRAVGTDQGQKFILVLNAKNEVEYRAVDVGQVFDGLREIKPFREISEQGPDGKDTTKKVEVLKSTDRVIVEGLMRVRAGMTAEPRMVDMVTLLGEPASSKSTSAKGTKNKS
jgi:RND family efflux transporter MFP subunit